MLGGGFAGALDDLLVGGIDDRHVVANLPCAGSV
jgi:hypothetical protein